jgi:excisionase family DNA binding protein
MSSNIEVQRICQHCGREFTAKTTVTRYCSHKCNSNAYKRRVRQGKEQSSDRETVQVRLRPVTELHAKAYLNINQASTLLGVSRWTLWRLIKNGGIPVIKIGRRTVIRRADIDNL